MVLLLLLFLPATSKHENTKVGIFDDFWVSRQQQMGIPKELCIAVTGFEWNTQQIMKLQNKKRSQHRQKKQNKKQGKKNSNGKHDAFNQKKKV